MNQFISSIKESLQQKNWFAALFIALSVPDVCGGINDSIKGGEKGHKKRFVNWFNDYLASNYKYINAEAFWQLRCSIMHSGSYKDKKLKQALGGAELIVVSPNETPFHDSCIKATKEESYVHLRIDKFCEDICLGIDKWIEEHQNHTNFENSLRKLFYLEKGFKAKEIILGDVKLNWGNYCIKGIYTDIPNKKGFKPFWMK